MDIQRTAQLAGILLEAADKVNDIKGFGTQWFYLVADVSDKDNKVREGVQLIDIISRVKLGSLFNIMNSFDPKNDFAKLNPMLYPMLYPDSHKIEALADAKARLAKMKSRNY